MADKYVIEANPALDNGGLDKKKKTADKYAKKANPAADNGGFWKFTSAQWRC
jgi:hypothetical protein